MSRLSILLTATLVALAGCLERKPIDFATEARKNQLTRPVSATIETGLNFIDGDTYREHALRERKSLTGKHMLRSAHCSFVDAASDPEMSTGGSLILEIETGADRRTIIVPVSFVPGAGTIQQPGAQIARPVLISQLEAGTERFNVDVIDFKNGFMIIGASGPPKAIKNVFEFLRVSARLDRDLYESLRERCRAIANRDTDFFRN